MPESVTDRPTSAHEHVFLLAKSPRYFYDADAIREDAIHAGKEVSIGEKSLSRGQQTGRGFGYHWGNGARESVVVAAGRNRRNVWEIATQPYPQAHFATFPIKLVEPCVLAGSSPMACGECGAPWKREMEAVPDKRVPYATTGSGPKAVGIRNDGVRQAAKVLREDGRGGDLPRIQRRMLGWQPSCPHNDNTGHSLILDPFAGTGTVGLVALRHDRSFIGIELSPAYCEMARNRIRQDAPLLNAPAEAVA